MTLDLGESPTVTLKVELEFVDAYLEIQRMRLGARLRLERRVDPGLLDLVVPAMILQPLVENAVDYAAARRTEGGTVGLWRGDSLTTAGASLRTSRRELRAPAREGHDLQDVSDFRIDH